MSIRRALAPTTAFSVAGRQPDRHPRPAQSAATGLPIHSTLYKGGLTASYDVDIWGANRSAASAAGASLEAQKPPPPPPI
jgi:outer membrane protein TolC